MHRAPSQAFEALRRNRSRYDQLTAVARTYAADGDREALLRAVFAAGAYGWRYPIGTLHDPHLERLVLQEVNPRRDVAVDATRERGRVLHVLTEAYVVGGHTRLAYRWIDNDPRCSDVALTHHSGPVPPALVEAVERSGGRIHHLAADHEASFTDRAVRLRALMDDADVVVQHVHPHDPIALAATALPGVRPPVVVENHAEHTYWLGLASADVVSNNNTFAHLLCHGLRGTRPERLGLVPLPLSDLAGAAEGRALRAELGLREHDVVALAVTPDHKIAPLWGRGMAPLLDRALTWCRDLHVVLAGPTPSAAWSKLSRKHQGRLQVLGRVADIGRFYAAADIYLDSYPSRSTTSVLEAALHGLPVVALQDMTEEYGYAHLYQADHPSLEQNPRAGRPEEYVTLLRSLASSPERRAELGGGLRERTLAAHCGEGWVTAMEDLYRQVRRAPAADLDEHPEQIEDPEYGAILLSYAQGTAPSPAVDDATPHLRGRLAADVYAAAHRERGDRVAVRAPHGWAEDLVWTSRLVDLANQHPRLSLSFPFTDGDDVAGSRTATLLTGVLEGLGRTTDDCGDIAVEADASVSAHAPFGGGLTRTQEALDLLDGLVTSPSWDLPTAPPATWRRRPAGPPVPIVEDMGSVVS